MSSNGAPPVGGALLVQDLPQPHQRRSHITAGHGATRSETHHRRRPGIGLDVDQGHDPQPQHGQDPLGKHRPRSHIRRQHHRTRRNRPRRRRHLRFGFGGRVSQVVEPGQHRGELGTGNITIRRERRGRSPRSDTERPQAHDAVMVHAARSHVIERQRPTIRTITARQLPHPGQQRRSLRPGDRRLRREGGSSGARSDPDTPQTTRIGRQLEVIDVLERRPGRPRTVLTQDLPQPHQRRSHITTRHRTTRHETRHRTKLHDPQPQNGHTPSACTDPTATSEGNTTEPTATGRDGTGNSTTTSSSSSSSGSGAGPGPPPPEGGRGGAGARGDLGSDGVAAQPSLSPLWLPQVLVGSSTGSLFASRRGKWVR